MLDYNYFKKFYKILAIDLSEQQALDSDPKAVQQINFTGNINRSQNVMTKQKCFSLLKKQKKPFLDFVISQKIVKVL